MNIHPMIVHFPVALLTLYALYEIISSVFPKINNRALKTLMLIIGFISGRLALMTWEIAEHIKWESDLVRIHSQIWEITIAIFGLLMAVYFCRYMGTKNWFGFPFMRRKLDEISVWMTTFLAWIEKWRLGILIGIVWLALMTAVGGFGGAIAYGCDMDFMTKFLCAYQQFFDN